MKSFHLTASVLAFAAASALPALARDQIQITGSSTVLPYATIVAEAFGENFDFPTPVVEGGGSGAGRKKLCEGVGENTVDIANSSSRISQSDIDLCAANGVAEIMEVRFGYDGIVFASDVERPGIRPDPGRHLQRAGAQRSLDGRRAGRQPAHPVGRGQPGPARPGHPGLRRPAPSTAPAKCSTPR